MADRSANATALTGDRLDGVDVAAPLRVGAGEVEGDRLAVERHGDDDRRPGAAGRRRARSSRGRRRTSTSRRAARRARRASVARRSRRPRRAAAPAISASRSTPTHVGADLGVEVAGPFVGRARVGASARPTRRRSSRTAECAGPPAGSRWRPPGSTPARRRRRRRGGPGWPPTRRARRREARRDERDVVEVGAARERVVEDHLVAGRRPRRRSRWRSRTLRSVCRRCTTSLQRWRLIPTKPGFLARLGLARAAKPPAGPHGLYIWGRSGAASRC